MKLEDQVCTLELAKKLKELGAKQDDSVFVRIEYDNGYSPIMQRGEETYIKTTDHFDVYAAFTVAELGEMLPGDYFSQKFAGDWAVFRVFQTDISEAGQSIFMVDGNTEADARANMLIYLLENKLITV